jgi:hypothetical protein
MQMLHLCNLLQIQASLRWQQYQPTVIFHILIQLSLLSTVISWASNMAAHSKTNARKHTSMFLHKKTSHHRPEARDDNDTRFHTPLRSIAEYMPLSGLMRRANRLQIGKDFWDQTSYHDRPLPETQAFADLVNVIHEIYNKMLNAKELARVLNANTHPKLFSSWLYVA